LAAATLTGTAVPAGPAVAPWQGGGNASAEQPAAAPLPNAGGPILWGAEAAEWRDDPASGARIIQLTSAAAISNNVYGEQPYCSPDGKRLVIARCQDFCFDLEGSLLVHDLSTLHTALIARRMVGVRGVCNAAWSGIVYYWTPQRRLMRLSLASLAVEEVYREEDPQAPLPNASVSPDQRYVIGLARRLRGPAAPTFQIVRLDLARKRRSVIFEHREISNPHLQFHPVHGKQILVQHDRGTFLLPDNSLEYRRNVGPGTRLFVLDADGGNQRELAAGPPHTASCTGHECFVSDTGNVAFSAMWTAIDDHHWTQDPAHPQGNLFTVAPGDPAPTVFPAPQYLFNHISVSRCGRYFVADAAQGGLFRDGRLQPVCLVMGNLQTGKHRVLVAEPLCYAGGNQCTHPHPYLTADNGHVIFNANPGFSIPQVFAARIPQGFLESLT
jgi:hypothetical protein